MKSWVNTWCQLHLDWILADMLDLNLLLEKEYVCKWYHNHLTITFNGLLKSLHWSHLIHTGTQIRLKSWEVSDVVEFLGQGSDWARWLQSAAGVWNHWGLAWDRPKGPCCLLFFSKPGCNTIWFINLKTKDTVWSTINPLTLQIPESDR